MKFKIGDIVEHKQTKILRVIVRIENIPMYKSPDKSVPHYGYKIFGYDSMLTVYVPASDMDMKYRLYEDAPDASDLQRL